MASIQQKLRITEGMTIVALHAPPDYSKILGKLPKGTRIATRLGKSNPFIHLFVKNKAELEKEIERTHATLAPGGLLWIAYPKGAKTDLTRDKGWESLEKLKMRWLSLISFDDNWTCFLVQNTPPREQSTASRTYHANADAWADPATKTVKVPDDLATQLKKNAKARTAYEALAYTNKKEYVMWIVGAKREETRSDRITKTIAKLVAGKKNPAEK
ncbi:MAG TPA: YdeI/OmpD-associated family protein [Flavobacteriales bacterium]|nr:YdeI/OmpD-associated family protein [Flavobacteriales bacterium]